MWTAKKKLYYILYSLFGKQWFESRLFPIGKRLRCFWAKKIMTSVGKNINIEKGAIFGPGVTMGDYSGVGINCELYGEISIGEHVMMGPEVVVYTRGHEHGDKSKPMMFQGDTAVEPVSIGNDVWIGRRVVILPGVAIGDGCIIGAGAIVTKDIPSYTVAAGNPAKVVKER